MGFTYASVLEVSVEGVIGESVMQKPDFIINTHPIVQAYLYELGYVNPEKDQGIEILDWIENPESVIKGKHVFGFVPLSMAQYAATVTMLPYDTSLFQREKREVLTLSEFIKSKPKPPQTYRISTCDYDGIDIITSRHSAILPYLYQQGLIKSGEKRPPQI